MGSQSLRAKQFIPVSDGVVKSGSLIGTSAGFTRALTNYLKKDGMESFRFQAQIISRYPLISPFTNSSTVQLEQKKPSKSRSYCEMRVTLFGL